MIYTPSSKVVVIGLDGATWRVLIPLMRAGKMPTLQRLAVGGVVGSLESTVPDLTPPAWTSFMTGKRPGNHGVFWFGRIDPHNRSFAPSSSQGIRAETLWQILSRHGREVGVVNVPMTFPPRSVNGFMITGMLTPGTHLQFTYPSSLRDEILQLVGEYHLDVPWQSYLSRDVSIFLTDLEAMTRQRAKVTRYLQDRYPVDMLMVVFVGPDRIHHALWGYVAEDADSGDLPDFPIIRGRIESFYTELDSIIGNLVAAAGPKANVILLSDHGFGPYRRMVFLNKWLAQLGLLTPRGSRWQRSLRSRIKELSKKLGLSPQRLSDAIGLEGVRKLKRVSSRIDWRRTKAYSTWIGIQINLAGRESKGIVQPGAEYEALRNEIIQQLGNLVDPETGKQAFTGLCKEEVYQGRYVEKAPGDIILFPNDDGYMAPSQAVDVPDVFARPPGWSPGCHRPDGIFLAHGPIFRQGITIEGAHITDITPIILHALGLPIPGDLDGRPLKRVFTPDFWATHPVHWERPSDPEDMAQYPTEVGLDEDDQAIVEDRLRALGYF